MKLISSDPKADKGWYVGPWNSDLGLSIGYANRGVDEPHSHQRIEEIYLVARGESTLRVDHSTYQLKAGDMIVIAAGEAHTFLASSPDYFHFVIHHPGLSGQAARDEKVLVSRGLLGL